MVGPAEALKEGMMGTVVSMNKGKSRGGSSAKRAEILLEHGPFVLVGLAAITALVVYCASGGPVSPWLVVVISQTGVIGGLVGYILTPDQFASNADTQTAQVSRIEWTRQRRLS